MHVYMQPVDSYILVNESRGTEPHSPGAEAGWLRLRCAHIGSLFMHMHDLMMLLQRIAQAGGFLASSQMVLFQMAGNAKVRARIVLQP